MRAGVTVRVAKGRVVTLTGAAQTPLALPATTGVRPEAFSALLRVAGEVLTTFPPASTAHFRSALRQWDRFCAWAGVHEVDLTPTDVIAYITARIAPPVDFPIIFGGPGSPIMTASVRREIAWIRRGREFLDSRTSSPPIPAMARPLWRCGTTRF